MSDFAQRASDARIVASDPAAEVRRLAAEVRRLESIILDAIREHKAVVDIKTCLTYGEIIDLIEGGCWNGVIRTVEIPTCDSYRLWLYGTSNSEKLVVKVLECGREFSRTMAARTGKMPSFESAYLNYMSSDEEDDAERIDACLDMAFYAADSAARSDVTESESARMRKIILGLLNNVFTLGVNPGPLIDIVHTANMSKFGEGSYLREDGKWIKPLNFIPPIDKIRGEIQRQRDVRP